MTVKADAQRKAGGAVKRHTGEKRARRVLARRRVLFFDRAFRQKSGLVWLHRAFQPCTVNAILA